MGRVSLLSCEAAFLPITGLEVVKKTETKNDLSIDCWDIPASTLVHEDDCLFKTTLYLLNDIS